MSPYRLITAGMSKEQRAAWWRAEGRKSYEKAERNPDPSSPDYIPSNYMQEKREPRRRSGPKFSTRPSEGKKDEYYDEPVTEWYCQGGFPVGRWRGVTSWRLRGES